MTKNTNTTSDDVRVSVASIYSDLLEKRKLEREDKEEKKRQEKEAMQQAEEEQKLNDDGTKRTKKERRESELDNWKEVIVGLVGDDLEYTTPKGSKKKYKKWIDDEAGQNVVLAAKPKKIKKQNFQKQFDPELNMLKSIVTDQNRFTADLQKRFNIAVGPATKDCPMPNKTLVELASVINAGRGNSLGVLREVGNLKKTIADLYMKQKKLDADTSSSGFNTQDIGLMGSNIASNIFGDDSSFTSQSQQSYAPSNHGAPMSTAQSQQSPSSPQEYSQTPQTIGQPSFQIEAFDPNTWGGPEIAVDSMVKYECIPHEVIVEMNKNDNTTRFKAIRTDTGIELPDYPVPTSDVSKLKINETDNTVKGEFDEIYRLSVV